MPKGPQRKPQYDPLAAVNALPPEHDEAIQAAMANAYDQGLREDADDDGHAFWSSVHGEVLSGQEN